jgi:hypothetical protein
MTFDHPSEGSEGIEGRRCIVLYRVHARARNDHQERAFVSLRKPSDRPDLVQSATGDDVRGGRARFLLGDVVCGGRQREGSPFCGAANG